MRRKQFPSSQGYPGDSILLMQVRRASGRIAVTGLVLALLVALAPAAYDYWQDDRPTKGTDACEAAQEAIFKDPALRQEAPINFVERVNAACK